MDLVGDGTRPAPGPSTNLARRERLRLVLERDGAVCVWCRRPIDTDLVRATTEHVVPRIKGGPSWIENEVAACARCNRERGHRTPAEWIDECERRGWEPDVDIVVQALRSLQGAIAERGGQRRARPYVAGQLRRLAR
jgi:CRISPR/Cas system Type II protein with McrA/HNH and RuvC-like nuclease domain